MVGELPADGKCSVCGGTLKHEACKNYQKRSF